jgi:anti-anti-sigma factor
MPGRVGVVIVDLRALEFLSCGGLHALVSAARRARATGGRLVVVHGPGAVQRLVEIVDVTFEIELVDRPPSRLPPPRCWRGEAA